MDLIEAVVAVPTRPLEAAADVEAAAAIAQPDGLVVGEEADVAAVGR
ncbi:hypothetical protein [Roseateles sp.]